MIHTIPYHPHGGQPSTPRLAHLLHIRGKRAQVSLLKLVRGQEEVAARKPGGRPARLTLVVGWEMCLTMFSGASL